jgi:hypothetical protein
MNTNSGHAPQTGFCWSFGSAGRWSPCAGSGLHFSVLDVYVQMLCTSDKPLLKLWTAPPYGGANVQTKGGSLSRDGAAWPVT